MGCSKAAPPPQLPGPLSIPCPTSSLSEPLCLLLSFSLLSSPGRQFNQVCCLTPNPALLTAPLSSLPTQACATLQHSPNLYLSIFLALSEVKCPCFRDAVYKINGEGESVQTAFIVALSAYFSPKDLCPHLFGVPWSPPWVSDFTL